MKQQVAMMATALTAAAAMIGITLLSVPDPSSLLAFKLIFCTGVTVLSWTLLVMWKFVLGSGSVCGIPAVVVSVICSLDDVRNTCVDVTVGCVAHVTINPNKAKLTRRALPTFMKLESHILAGVLLYSHNNKHPIIFDEFMAYDKTNWNPWIIDKHGSVILFSLLCWCLIHTVTFMWF